MTMILNAILKNRFFFFIFNKIIKNGYFYTFRVTINALYFCSLFVNCLQFIFNKHPTVARKHGRIPHFLISVRVLFVFQNISILWRKKNNLSNFCFTYSMKILTQVLKSWPIFIQYLHMVFHQFQFDMQCFLAIKVQNKCLKF